MGSKLSVSAVSFEYSNKSVTQIPHDVPLAALYKLRHVDLSQNKLIAINEEICSQIRTFPAMLDSLTELNLSSNSLINLPDEICYLIKLKKLDVSHNSLDCLPDHFFSLFKLEKLYLNNNNLKSLPHGIISLRNLKVIRMHNNKISWLPRDLGSLTGIKELTVHKNPFIDRNILDTSELQILMRMLKSNQNYQPETFTKEERELTKSIKMKDRLHELKGGKMFAFRNMVYNKTSAAVFKKYLEKEYASENLEFIWAVDNFRYQTYNCSFPVYSRSLVKDANVIYETYVKDKSDSAAFTINITSAMKSRLDETFANLDNVMGIDQWVFSESCVHILKLMLEDSFKRFCQTAEGKSTWLLFERYEIEENKRIAQRKLKSTSIDKSSSMRDVDVSSSISTKESSSLLSPPNAST